LGSGWALELESELAWVSAWARVLELGSELELASESELAWVLA
jgi:hypothetical protein